MNGRKFIPLVVVAAGLLAYHNSFSGPFIFDDFYSIEDNPTIHHLWPIWQTLSPPRIGAPTVEGRPLVNLSLAINYALGGYRVWGYHALNLTIHILAALTLFGIVRRTLLQPRFSGRFGAAADGLALAVAVLWMVHPLQTESVTYIIQRAESLMGLFYLLTLYCFIRAADLPQPRVWYGLCVGACALGMASKEVMASAPLIVMLYDRAFVAGSLREAWRRRWKLYLALASTWILLGYLMTSAGGRSGTAGFTGKLVWWQYALTQSYAIARYLALTVWPHPLVLDYGSNLVTGLGRLAPCILIVGLLGVGTAISVRRWPALGFLGCWFFAILAPTSSVVPVAVQTMAEHRMYLPLAAVVTLGVMGIHALAGRRTAIVVTALAIGLGCLTWQRNQDYRTDVSIWSDTVGKWPQNPRAHTNLGFALSRAGRIPEAIGQYDQALRIKPDYAWAHDKLGVALANLGRVPEAIGEYEQALQINPDFAEAHYNLAVALERTGKIPEAIGHYEQALRIKPDYAEAHNNLGSLLFQGDRLPEAIEHYEQAVRIRPDFAEAHYNLGLALARLDRMPEAIEHYQLSLQLNPTNAEVHLNWGVALAQSGQMQEALGHWEQAVRLNPDYAEAHNDLGIALQRAGRLQEAIGQYEQALRIQPEYTKAHYNLGVALEQAGRVQDAIGHYQQALRINPDLSAARAALTRVQAHQELPP